MADTTDIHVRFAQLRRAYRAQLAEKLDNLIACWEQLACDPLPADAVETLYRQAHNLAGSGATFGYTDLSQAAHRIELTLAPLRDVALPAALAAPVLAEVAEAVRTLVDLGETLPAGDDGDQPAALAALAPHATPLSATRAQNLLVADGDLQSCRSLALQLSSFGYAVHTIGSPAELALTPWAEAPSVIILDLLFAAPDGATAPSIIDLAQAANPPIPIVYMAQRSDLEARLQAVRAGGAAFFPKPVDANDLITVLDRITNVAPPEPYRVLIVDDSPLVAHLHATILRGAGMRTTVVTNPAELLPALSDQPPDLVLLDMYMPGCTGQELAAVIRQQAAFHSLPIVYLSAETDRDVQLAAMGHGGDDFLTKPVPPAHLITAVTSRVERARAIRGQLNRDSLTGLLTHAAIKEQLARELMRVQRYGTWLSVVMIDVDYFKRVNDSYGHAVGDRVLISLARLLRQHLRASDMMGRYGGEEFLVLLPETDGEGAQIVIDRLRAKFALIPHQSGEISFTVSFSAGICSLPPFGDPGGTIEAADGALYAAKQGGRNRVLRADMMRISTPTVPGPAPNALRAPAVDGWRGPVRALVVDDDPDLRAVLEIWLCSWQWVVAVVTSGAEALAAVATFKPDVVLLDALMPGMGGLDVLSQLRARGLDAAVILTTAFSSEQLVVSALRGGADDYVRKPLDPAELRAVMERTLSRLRLRRTHAPSI